MKRIIIPALPYADLPFYLAVEEWVARSLPAGEYFFAWQVAPAVICGRHQEIDVEVDLDYAESNGIYVWRRKSGGGAVYADFNNVMFSYITPSSDVQTTFKAYTSMICCFLRSLGIDAEPTGRNDIAVAGFKVAGNAFYKLPGCSIVHGTMLYDADFDTMGKVLTPTRAKRQSKGVLSVPSRVSTLRKFGLDCTCNEFIDATLCFLCKDGSYTLGTNDLHAINEIRQTYLDHTFLNLRTHHKQDKVLYYEGIGQLRADVSLDAAGYINDVKLYGDIFPIKPFDTFLLPLLQGVSCNRSSLLKALANTDTSAVIAGMTPEILADVICHNNK